MPLMKNRSPSMMNWPLCVSDEEVLAGGGGEDVWQPVRQNQQPMKHKNRLGQGMGRKSGCHRSRRLLFGFDRPALFHVGGAGIGSLALVLLNAVEDDFAGGFFLGEHHVALGVLYIGCFIELQLV